MPYHKNIGVMLVTRLLKHNTCLLSRIFGQREDQISTFQKSYLEVAALVFVEETEPPGFYQLADNLQRRLVIPFVHLVMQRVRKFGDRCREDAR